ncbi:MAG: hypothetical protein GKS00_14435 [Alphaproteobacteria bacterium]|nr:hypothetical protein [Alphaproteobacteria bacterium]
MGRLFQTDILNKSVVLKQYEKVLPKTGKSTMFDSDFLQQFGGGQKTAPTVNVNTVIYFPYDFENPYAGGESILYTGRKFIDLLAQKISQGSPSSELIERLKADETILDLLESMHSLDPFIFRSKIEQVGIEAKIHEAYFAISSEEWELLQYPIRDKIARLVTKALGEVDGDDDATSEQDHINHFLNKIWHAKDVEGIEPFVKSLQIEPDEAPSLFFAWKAVCYYQLRFAQLMESLKTMFHWIGNDQLCYPTDSLQLSKGQQNRLVERRAALRKAARDGFIATHKILSEYEHSYDQFVNEDRPRLFLNFLAEAEDSYLLLSNHVSIATHSVNFWRTHMARYGGELRREEFMPLFDGLLVLYDVRIED